LGRSQLLDEVSDFLAGLSVLASEVGDRYQESVHGALTEYA